MAYDFSSLIPSASPFASAGLDPQEALASDDPYGRLSAAQAGVPYQAKPGQKGTTLAGGTPSAATSPIGGVQRSGVSSPPDGGAVRTTDSPYALPKPQDSHPFASPQPADNAPNPPSEKPSGPQAVPASVQPGGGTPMSALQRQTIQGQLTAAQSAANAAGTQAPDMAGLEAKKVAAATAAPQLNDPTHPEYKPSLKSRFLRGVEGVGLGLAEGGLRGAIAGGIAPQTTGLSGYRDPSSAFNRASAANQKQVGDLDQQLQAAKDTTAAQGEAIKNQTGIAGAFGGVGKDIVAQQNAGTKSSQVEETAAKAGQKVVRDADGNITGFEDDPDSEAFKSRKVLDDVRQTQQSLNEAKTEVEKSKNDPNSPAYRLAVQKAQTAASNASAAQVRAQAYMGNYLQGAFNRDLQGNTLPGTPQIRNDQGQVTSVGTKNANNAIKLQGNAAQFNDVHGALDGLESAAKALVKSGGSLNGPAVSAALAQPHGTLNQWLQGEGAKSHLSPQERDYVIANAAAHENIQALRKAVGSPAIQSSVDKLDALIPNASTPDLDYFLKQTGQIRATANRLGKGAPTVQGGLSVRGQESPPATAPPSSGKEVSLAAAKALPQNKDKSDADIRKDIEAHGHRVKE